jgi:hypothetical protein
VFPLLTVLLVATNLSRPESLAGIGAGIAIGLGLGIYGLRVTRFEATAEGLFYTPSAHVGIALSLLLAGRIIYRLIQVNGITGTPAGSPINYATTPLTLLIFGTLAGYYVTYAVGLIRWQRGAEKPTGAAS